METAFPYWFTEDGKAMYLAESVVIHPAGPDGPVASTYSTVFHHLMLAFQQMCLEFGSRLLWENLVQSIADGVNLGCPDRVALVYTSRILGTSLEIHIYLILWDTAGHQLTVATQNISTIRLYGDAITLQSRGHLSPIILFGSHDVHGFAHYGKTNQREYYCYDEVARHDFIAIELTHLVSLFWYINNIRWLVGNMQQRISVLLQCLQHMTLTAFLCQGT